MFRWYQSAVVCYAYLSDVYDLTEFESSRWFTRGWTLQELVAPKDVKFYSSKWKLLGSKHELSEWLYKITNITPEVLKDGFFDHINIAARMSWASSRQTTRVEDVAYSLMGIFDVNIPLLYGEGEKAFIRLQEAIMKDSDDQTLFAWGLGTDLESKTKFFESTKEFPDRTKYQGIFAKSPADFIRGHQIELLEDLDMEQSPVFTASCLRITLPTFTRGSVHVAVLSCKVKSNRYIQHYLGIPLFAWSGNFKARCGDLLLVEADSMTAVDAKPLKWLWDLQPAQSLRIKHPPRWTAIQPLRCYPPVQLFNIRMSGLEELEKSFILEDVYCLPHTQFSKEDCTISTSEQGKAVYAALFFSKATQNPSLANSYWKERILEVYGEEPSQFSETRQTRHQAIAIARRTATNPKFALIIGGDAREANTAWLKYVEIINEISHDEDVRYSMDRESNVHKSCMTRKQLLSSSWMSGRTNKVPYFPPPPGRWVLGCESLGLKLSQTGSQARSHWESATTRERLLLSLNSIPNIKIRWPDLPPAMEKWVLKIPYAGLYTNFKDLMAAEYLEQTRHTVVEVKLERSPRIVAECDWNIKIEFSDKIHLIKATEYSVDELPHNERPCEEFLSIDLPLMLQDSWP